MKIQLITSRSLQESDFPHVTISEFGEPLSLDEFDVNVIDLGSDSLWRTKEQNNNTVDRVADFTSIQSMVMHRKKAFVIYALPKDLVFLSHDYSKGAYKRETRLKNVIKHLKMIAQVSFPLGTFFPDLLYEKTKTTIGSKTYEADFYFDQSYDLVTQSDLSRKPTTIKSNGYLLLSTLDILKSEEYLLDYIRHVMPNKEHEAVPDWVNEIECFDDSSQKGRISVNHAIIEHAQAEIKASEDRLAENMYYKSILYTNGSELVDVVFSVLEKLLRCDLSKFVDEKKEDFQVKKPGYTLIGEIKGVTSNIKNEHISQVDVHYQGYMDKLAEEGIQENVHQVLIMNPFRNKPLSEREPVHDTQIKLAERNGCLIIETMTLLKLYEKFVAGIVDIATCEKLFTEKTGLLKESDFCDSAAT